MKKDQIYMKLFSFSRPTYYKWKREKIPAIQLIQSYFNDEDLQEFLEKGKIRRFEKSLDDTDISDLIIHDQAYYNARQKMRLLTQWRVGVLDIIQEALLAIDPKDNSFTLANSKQRLIDTIRGIERNLIRMKTSQKIELVADLIENEVSKLEAYALVKHSTIILKNL